MFEFIVIMVGIQLWLLAGICYSIPTTYGTARAFWKHKQNPPTYRALFGPLYLLAMTLSGPLMGWLMVLCAALEGAAVRHRWPSLADWELAVSRRAHTKVIGDVGVRVQATAVR